jgi:hypothetical protein
VDLDKLKDEIKSFSVDDYSKILSEINESKNPVILSQQVFNCPNLSQKYPFWKIEKGFQIHRGNIDELMDFLGVEKNWIFLATEGKKFENKEEFLDRFKTKFDLEDKNVQLINDKWNYFLFWMD